MKNTKKKIRVSLEKKSDLVSKWNWDLDFHFQQIYFNVREAFIYKEGVISEQYFFYKSSASLIRKSIENHHPRIFLMNRRRKRSSEKKENFFIHNMRTHSTAFIRCECVETKEEYAHSHGMNMNRYNKNIHVSAISKKLILSNALTSLCNMRDEISPKVLYDSAIWKRLRWIVSNFHSHILE